MIVLLFPASYILLALLKNYIGGQVGFCSCFILLSKPSIDIRF